MSAHLDLASFTMALSLASSPVLQFAALFLCVIDSPAGRVVCLLAVTFTRTWTISMAPARRGHARPRVLR